MDERLKLRIEGWKLWMMLDGVERRMVSFVALVLPDVDCRVDVSVLTTPDGINSVVGCSALTKRITITDFCPPAAHKVYPVLRHARHAWIPPTNKLDILVHLVRLHLVKHNAVDVLASSEHLTEGALDVAVHLAAFFRAVDEITEPAAGFALAARFVRFARGFSCCG